MKLPMTTQLLFLNLGAPELFLIILVILLLFGGKKIPELMRGLGKGIKSFKEGMNEVEKDIRNEADSTKTDAVKKDTTASSSTDNKELK